MNKRQVKKLDKKLYLAIRKLNDDVAKSEGFAPVTTEEIDKAFVRVKKSKNSIKQVLRHYKNLGNLI